MNYCPPEHRWTRTPPIYLYESGWKWGKGSLGVLIQKMLKLVDVISCILVPFWGWPAGDLFRFIAFCFLTYWGSDFTQRLGLQGPFTSWVIQVHSVELHPKSILALSIHTRCLVYAHDSNAGRHSRCRQVYWSWNQNHLVLNYSFIHVTCLMS